jgi:NAD(P)-dependent dehydrogenase (short-subunit alcohol dehydrogenase family)
MDRRALVTGGSRGIGQAIAERLAVDGIEVLAPQRAELDLADDSSVDRYVARLTQPVDILVNNAGVNVVAGLEELSDAGIAETIAVNLLGPLRLCRALAPPMCERGWGRIVNVGSVFGIVTKPRRTIYTVTKAGLHGMTRALAVELAPRGVLVNSVAPGIVDTEMTRLNNSPADIQDLLAAVPLGRLVGTQEIAAVVAFLCSDESSAITGQVLVVDGGFTCL